jgi:hypothetical protein
VWAQFATSSDLDDDERQSARDGLVTMMVTERDLEPFAAAVRARHSGRSHPQPSPSPHPHHHSFLVWQVRAGQWQKALSALDKVPRALRSAPRLQLIEARCSQMLGKWGNAQRSVCSADQTYHALLSLRRPSCMLLTAHHITS